MATPSASPLARADLAPMPQRAADLRARSQLGGFFYAMAWAVMAGFGGGFIHYPLISSLMLCAFVGLAIWRLRMPAAPSLDPEAARYLGRLWGIILASAGLFGGLSAWVLLDPRLAAAEMVTLLCVISLGTACAQVYSIDRMRALLGCALISLPSLVIEAVDRERVGVVLVLLFHFVYLTGLVLQSHREHLSRLGLEVALRDERDRYEQQSRTDPLTGLANRRRFEFSLHRWIEQAGGLPAWLVILDIDHFKRINDSYGHPVGDAALLHVAEGLRQALKEREHVLARLGGEEFGVLFRAASVDEAIQVADALRLAPDASPFAVPGGEVLTLRLSGGLARLVDDAAEAYRRADMALYRAKADGRDRTVHAAG